MASITTVTVLLLVLMQCCCCGARRKPPFVRAGFTKGEIEKCKCKHITNATYKCPLLAMPITGEKDRIKAMKACLCSLVKTSGRTNTKKFCRYKPTPRPPPPGPPIPL